MTVPVRRAASIGTVALVILIPPTTLLADLPSLYATHWGVASTSTSNNFPQGTNFESRTAEGSYLIPTFGWYITNDHGYFDFRMSPIYADLTALLSYSSGVEDDLEDGVFSSGILGHFVYGRYFLHGPLVSLGGGVTLGEYGFDSEALDEGYNFTVGPNLRASLNLEDLLLANLTTRYDYALWHLAPDTRSEADNADKPAFLAFTLQLFPYGVTEKLAADVEYWKVLSSETDDLEVDRWQFKISYRLQRDDDF